MQSRGEWESRQQPLSIEQAPRETRYPGVAAWLQVLLRDYCERESSSGALPQCLQVLTPLAGVPIQLEALGHYLTFPTTVDHPPSEPTRVRTKPAGQLCASEPHIRGTEFRRHEAEPRTALHIPAGRLCVLGYRAYRRASGARSDESRALRNRRCAQGLHSRAGWHAHLAPVRRRFGGRAGARVRGDRSRAADVESAPTITSVRSLYSMAKSYRCRLLGDPASM